MYRIPVCRVMLVRERSLAAEIPTIRGPDDAAQLLRQYLEGCDREHIVVLCLDRRHRVIAINTVAVGDLTSAPVHPREVFKPAILANSAAVIVGHNHPGGDPEPSYEDRVATDRLVKAGDILGIEVLDHVIVADTGFTSLARRGLISAARLAG
jgi:DNA repair protein RadC